MLVPTIGFVSLTAELPLARQRQLKVSIGGKRGGRGYQWRKALRRNMAVNCSLTRLNIS